LAFLWFQKYLFKGRIMRRIILIIVLTSAVSGTLSAHPHLFIKPEISVINENNVISGIDIEWEWDEWWSRDVIENCDLDKNGQFDKKETESIYNDFFIGIKDYNFFMEIYANKKRQTVKNVINFSAKAKNKIVTYKFTVPLNLSEANINFRIAFNDETIYTSFADIKLIIREIAKLLVTKKTELLGITEEK